MSDCSVYALFGVFMWCVGGFGLTFAADPNIFGVSILLFFAGAVSLILAFRVPS